MAMELNGGGITKAAAVGCCSALAVLYVGILYFPSLVLRLPPPNSFKSFMIRRFLCVGVSSLLSVILCAFMLPIRSWDAIGFFRVYGIRFDHISQAVIFPLILTSFMYYGSFAAKLLSVIQAKNESFGATGSSLSASISVFFSKMVDGIVSGTSNILSWRNYVVAPLTEELVFRACMIPLLLCGGFNTYAVVFLCPLFFSLAHLNHLYEFYVQKNHSLPKACQLVGFQLGYTVIYGAYASFLFIRTGHISAPLVAHIFCNFMGLPVVISRKSGIITAAFILGFLGFVWMIFPLTEPSLYNHHTDSCNCWHKYCTWS